MEHLYIIGNGFDIFSGLKTSYRDFRKWLKNHYIFALEALEATYGNTNIEWWNDFEASLGKLDISRYVAKYTPPQRSISEIIKEVAVKRKNMQQLNLPPSLSISSPCADRLSGLFGIIHYCLGKWINSMTSVNNPKMVKLALEDSCFVNFNYTNILELWYKIPKDRILHIHGCAADQGNKLIFGHNSYRRGTLYPFDGDKVCDVLERYHKNPYEYIFKNDVFFEKINGVKFVHIFGLSFSPVDIDYIDWIYHHTPKDATWEVSWYSDEDKKRIDNFILEHFNLNGRIKKIQLESIEQKQDLD